MQVIQYFCDHCGEEEPLLKSFHVELNACHAQNEFNNRLALAAAQQGVYGLAPSSPIMPDVQFTAQLCESCYGRALLKLKAVQAWALEKATLEAKH